MIASRTLTRMLRRSGKFAFIGLAASGVSLGQTAPSAATAAPQAAIAAPAQSAPAAGTAAAVPAATGSAPARISSPTASAARPAASANTAPTYDTFRFIGDWNIFNPYRVGRSNGESAPPASETITFVGTMEYSRGNFAFFNSPTASYRKAVKVGDTIAQFTVKDIKTDEVDLTRDSKDTALKIGQQLSRPPGGDWILMGIVKVDNTPAAAAATIPADASDVLRRLMEQRQKQLKQ